jgi:hypothetical protein
MAIPRVVFYPEPELIAWLASESVRTGVSVSKLVCRAVRALQLGEQQANEYRSPFPGLTAE